MDTIVAFVTGLPMYGYAAFAALVAVGIIIVVVVVTARRRFVHRVRTFIAIPGAKSRNVHFTDEEILRRTRLVERLIAREGEDVVRSLEIDRLWIARLSTQARRADFRRVLAHAPELGLFTCFLSALKNVGLRSLLRTYLSENSDFLVLRRLAMSGRGEEFDGAAGRDFFSDRLDEIREMTGDPEWPSRYFAVKILLTDTDDRSVRALWDGFRDPHPLVRRTVAAEFVSAEREHLYENLLELFRDDPVFEVRTAAKDRIHRDFRDLYTFDAAALSPEQALHTVELLDPESTDDENAALGLLAGGNLELRLAAARFLTRCGTLDRLFLSADPGDREDLDRSLMLLTNAASVGVRSFLASVRKGPGTGSLLVAARLLQTGGPPDAMRETAERVFRLQSDVTPGYAELYRETVHALSSQAADEPLRLLDREIIRRKGSPELLRIVLLGIPAGHDHIFAPTLIDALKDPEFPERDALRNALGKLETSVVLSAALDIVTSNRERYDHRVRIDALKLLGELNLPYTLQDILEHLPILPLDEARRFTEMLAGHQPAELDRKVRSLLASVDGTVRAAVIAALPATGKKTFLTEIKQALSDADPDVRISATWALVDYGENRALTHAASMLRDPVERVRSGVARALGTAGTPAALEALKSTLTDENETHSVKRSAIEGLGASTAPEAVDLLVSALETDDDLRPATLDALAAKSGPRSISRLVEHFKDAPPALRDHITTAFRMMGDRAEDSVRTVLDEDISSLKPYLAEILEATGYIESRIRMLNHRDPSIRRSAALFLSKVGNQAAFRGIVLAARDPDEEVRVQVTRALEQLATDEGSGILKELEQDPDRRIRRYTRWALQRIAAKSL